MPKRGGALDMKMGLYAVLAVVAVVVVVLIVKHLRDKEKFSSFWEKKVKNVGSTIKKAGSNIQKGHLGGLGVVAGAGLPSSASSVLKNPLGTITRVFKSKSNRRGGAKCNPYSTEIDDKYVVDGGGGRDNNGDYVRVVCSCFEKRSSCNNTRKAANKEKYGRGKGCKWKGGKCRTRK
jgi:hypothetical protein